MHLNYLTSFTDRTVKQFYIQDGKSVNEAIAELWTEVERPDCPFIVKVNGIPKLRASWNDIPTDGSMVDVICVPGEVMTVLTVTSLVLTLVSLAYTAYLISELPSGNVGATGQLPEAENVFSFTGQKNVTKLNSPIEVSYGINLWTPPYMTLPRIYFENNRVYMDLLFSLGMGRLDVEDVFVGTVNVNNIAESNWSKFSVDTVRNGPMFDNVFMSDVTTVSLAAPDEDSFEVIRTILNPSGTVISDYQINYAFPGGLYSAAMTSTTVDFKYRIRQVDDRGRALSDWTSFTTITTTKATTTPQRFTHSAATPSSGRWELEIQRVTNKGTGQDSLQFVAAYGLRISYTQTPVNTLRVKLAGSNVIDESAASNIKVKTSRNLVVYRNGVASTEPSRNPVWAIVDLLKASYGGNIPVADLDLSYWEEMAAKITTTFDYVVTNKTTVWEMIQNIASSFRAKCFVIGSDFRLAIDGPELVPVAFFGPDNAANLTWQTVFPSRTESDCVEAVYVDPITGLQTSVQFTPYGSEAGNPKTLTCFGIQDRTTAWRMAAYKYLQNELLRERVTFDAGIDGFIPMYGDLVTVAWPFPAWEVAGLVYTQVGLVLTVSEPLEAGSGFLSLRSLDGRMYGPVAATASGNTITLGAALVGDWDFDDYSRESVMFTWGKASTLKRNFRVTSATPSENSVKIEAVAYDLGCYTYDSIAAPDNDRIPFATATGVSWIIVREVSSAFYKVIWPTPRDFMVSEIQYAYEPAGGDSAAINPSTVIYTNTVGTFGNVAYIPKQSGRLFIKIPNGTGVYKYWRSTLNPLIATLGNTVVAGAPGAFTHNANTSEMIVVIDTPISDEPVTVTYTSGTKTCKVPMAQTGSAIFTNEILRIAGIAGDTGSKSIKISQDGVDYITGSLTVSPITIPSGGDNYITATESQSNTPVDLCAWWVNFLETDRGLNVNLYTRFFLTIICDAVNEYSTTWGKYSQGFGTVGVTSKNRDLIVDATRFKRCAIDSVTGDSVHPVSGSFTLTSGWYCVLLKADGTQIRPIGNHIFWANPVSGGNIKIQKRIEITGDFYDLDSSDKALISKTASLVWMRCVWQADQPYSWYVELDAHLNDYFGGVMATTAKVQVLATT